MHTMIRQVLLSVTIVCYSAVATADEPVPLTVSLRPQMLALAPTAKIELRCKLTNVGDKPIAVDWDTLQLSMFPRQINVGMSHGPESKKVELAAGESRTLPIVFQLGKDLPALNEGDYDLAINLAMDAEGRRRHMQEKLPFTVVAHEGEKPALTAESLVAAAREHAIKKGLEDELNFQAYRIRRRGDVWDLEISQRGPKSFGVRTVVVNANGEVAHELPIP